MTHPRELLAFLDDLDRRGITYPNLGRTRHLITHLSMPDVSLWPTDPLNLADSDATDLVSARAVVMVAENHLGNARADLQQQVTKAALERLTPAADDILNQVRPRFDKAAAVFTKARKAGVESGVTAEVIVDLGAAAVDAYRAIKSTVADLEDLAQFRASLGQVLGIGPEPTTAAAFTSAPVPFRQRGEDAVATWLRLARLGLRLNTAAEARRIEAERPQHTDPMYASARQRAES